MRRYQLPALVLVLATGCGDNRTFPDREPFDAGSPRPLECVPDLDGRITAEELQASFDVSASFLVSEDQAVDLDGRVDEDGQRVWDWSTDLATDRTLRVSAVPIEERWYAAEFPSGEFATEGVLPGRVEGVFRQDERALWLLGFASAEMSPPEGQTLLIYDAPIALYRFPIEPGREWNEVGRVENGTLLGLPYAGRDVYEVRVDATGRLELPDLSFAQAHRVRIKTTIEPAVGTPTVTRQVQFLFECFGEVARAVAPAGETDDDFETAAQLRRLSL
jgi:hypothetical protein